MRDPVCDVDRGGSEGEGVGWEWRVDSKAGLSSCEARGSASGAALRSSGDVPASVDDVCGSSSRVGVAGGLGGAGADGRS